MSDWYSEAWTEGVKISVKINAHLHHEKTPFQTIDVYDSADLGRFFTLDGLMMVAEKDEWIYHEMISHVPLAVHPNVKRVLVLGGGDGGTVRELVRYPSIEQIDFVEIDRRVVEISQQFFPEVSRGVTDPRVHLNCEDGVAFIQRVESETYDLILIDSTDPIGPGERLFFEDFYRECFRALKEDGILINQHESPYFPNYCKHMKHAHRGIKQHFPITDIYQFHQPFYPSGFWLFGFASKTYHPLDDHRPKEWEARALETRYYNSALHRGAFALPNFVLKELADA